MKNLNLKSLLIFAFSLLAITSNAQEVAPSIVKLTGTVIDAQKHPIDFVTISLLKGNDSTLLKTAMSDTNGNYTFSDVHQGNYIISARMFGYKTTFTNKIIVDGKNQLIKLPALQLVLESKTLKEVTVVAQKPFVERKMDRLIVNVESSSVSAGATALEVLQRSPGVTVDQNDNIAMQGKQGVIVMLDGKQTYMSNTELVNMLKNMQSSDIEIIELITNPSAKYDANGNAGIINIKTKKGKGYGTNGSANAGYGKGKNYRANSGISLNHRNKDLNIFGNYNFNKYQNIQVINIDRISEASGEQDFFSQGSNNFRSSNNNNYKLGVDIFLNKKNTLGLLVNGYTNGGRDLNDSRTFIGQSFSQPDSSILVNNNATNSYNNRAYNINYKSVIDTLGQEISADADYSHYYAQQNANYDNFFLNLNGQQLSNPLLLQNSSPSKIKIASFKVDYVKPITKEMKLEAGLKSSWVTTDNDFRFTELKGNLWENDANRSNHFIYDENVNAAYVNINKQFKKAGIQLGLRAEQTNSKGDLITNANVVKRNYINFFPSVFVNRALSANHDISFSYSRRIDRPRYDALNPFVYYLDQYTYNQGNSFLNPQFTNNFEVAYTYKKMYNFTLGYSLTNDVITEVILPDTLKKALYQTIENLDKQINYNANLNAPVKFFKWWNSSNNISVFYMGFRSADLRGKNLNSGRVALQLNSQQNYTINKTLNAEWSANYTSPIEYGTLSIKSQFGIDAGISTSFLDKKLSLKLAMSDIFNTYRQRISSTYEGLNYSLFQKHETRVARINITYRFGKNEISPTRRRVTGLEAEQGRMKN